MNQRDNNKCSDKNKKLEAAQLWQRLREPKKHKPSFMHSLYDKSITTIQENLSIFIMNFGRTHYNKRKSKTRISSQWKKKPIGT
jgi:redox-sensitive bicupin YhaK (pirin superfamily)